MNGQQQIANKFYMTGSSSLPTGRQAQIIKIAQDYPPP
jgi:hypothetical protein